MSNFQVQGTVTVDDQASSQLDAIGESSQNLVNNFQTLGESATEVNRVTEAFTENSLALNDSERAQLANFQASTQLREAQNLLSTSQKDLNQAITKYGADSTQAATALRNYHDAQITVNSMQQEIDKNTKALSVSTKDLIVNISGLATSAFSLYNAFDRVQNSELAVDKANLQVKTSLNSLEDAQRSYNDAIVKYGENSEQAQAKQKDLQLAQERYQIATEHADQTQQNLNNSMVSASLQIIPTTITMVSSLSEIWKKFPNMTNVLTLLNTNVATVGLTAQTAALGVGAFIGGFLIGYTAITQFGDALGPVGRDLMVIIPIIIAAAAAIWALQSGLTLGTALVGLAATGIAVGALVAQLQSGTSVPSFAEGGIVTAPTRAIIGEAGPEAVVPLDRYGSLGGTTYNITIQGSVDKSTADYLLRQLERQT